MLREQTPVTADSLPRELRGEMRPLVTVAPSAQPVGELPSEPRSQLFEHEEQALRTAGSELTRDQSTYRVGSLGALVRIATGR